MKKPWFRSIFLLLLLAASTLHCSANQGSCSKTCQSSGDACADETIVGCQASCGEEACTGSTFLDSQVSCSVDASSFSFSEACQESIFNRSSVKLLNTECSNCYFWFSAVTTDGPFSTFPLPAFSLCSCCDDTSGTGNCPEGVPSCNTNTQEFCATQMLFKTCKDWGNPVCSDLQIAPAPIITSADTCSQGVDTLWCTEEQCHGLQVSNCTALCVDGSCSTAMFNDSVVGCYTYSGYTGSCQSATFERSSVVLDNSDCGFCLFLFSAVTYHSPTDTSHSGPLFGFCSCCDDTSGSGKCPEGIPSCIGQEFCSNEVHVRTCKDWGNPVCADLEIPSLPAKTSADTCSQGVDTLWCTEEQCQDLQVSSCTTICVDGSCTGAMFNDSVVGCYMYTGYTETCQSAKFERSMVSLENSGCRYCLFLFSAVTFHRPPVSSFSEPLFGFCSCCDDSSGSGKCPEGVPSCSSKDFCSNEVHFKTCKDWGNPVCADLEIPSVPAKFSAATCSEGLDVVLCGDGECDALTATNCSTICIDESCTVASFRNSDVGCYQYAGYGDPCGEGTFERSLVTLSNTGCANCYFWFSAVKINSELGSYSTSLPHFGECSCCDDTSGQGHCPAGVPSCQDPVSFCSSLHLGMSCKDWGNPICSDAAESGGSGSNMTTIPTSTNTTIVGGYPNCSLAHAGDEFLTCTGVDCAGLEAKGCAMVCSNEACSGALFEDSGVACLGPDTCTGATFRRSEVDCTSSNCDNADFFGSAVMCGDGEFFSVSCNNVVLSRCSCCDGGDCPTGDQNSCRAPGFCNMTALGRTCKDWQHPHCKDVDIPSVPPMHPAKTCSLGEEIYFCDEGENGCLGLEATDCTVSCHGKVCNDAAFEDSFVQCFDRAIQGWTVVYPGEGCVGARFTRSFAVCQNSCVGATFENSVAVCMGPSCTDTTFSECSCCDGDGCPKYGVPSCEGNLEEICTRVVDGQTCACRGFPECGKEHLSSCGKPVT